MSSKGKTEYFGYIPNVKVPDWLEELPNRKQTVSLNLDMNQAEEALMAFAAAVSHHKRAKRQKSGGRSQLKPINQVTLTLHMNHKMMTILGSETGKVRRTSRKDKIAALTVKARGGDDAAAKELVRMLADERIEV